jgi:hypothetical protein
MKIGDFIVDFLSKFEAIFKKALTRVSGAYGELFDEKTRGRKSHVRVPLTMDMNNEQWTWSARLQR